MERTLVTIGLYFLAVQPSFASSGEEFWFREFILLIGAIGAAYWAAGYYFKTRRKNTVGGFIFPYPVWFVAASIVAAMGNVLLMTWVFSVGYESYIWKGMITLFYFVLGWTIPGTAVALAQMMQTPSPSSFAEAHNKILIPSLIGYYLTMLFMNDIARGLGLAN